MSKHDISIEIGKFLELQMWESLTFTEKNKVKNDNRTTDYYVITLSKYMGISLLNVVCKYPNNGKKSIFTLNLKTCKPTKNSQIQKQLPKELIEKIIKFNNTPADAMIRKSVPSAVRATVWDKYMGPFTEGECFCCSRDKITVFNWDAGHIISVKYGGTDHVDNLRPICRNCNSSMGTQNMIEFMNKCGFVRCNDWDGFVFVDDQIQEDEYDDTDVSDSLEEIHEQCKNIIIGNARLLRGSNNVANNDKIFLSKLMKFVDEEKLDLLYVTNEMRFGNLNYADTFLGMTNLRLFSYRNGTILYQLFDDISDVTYVNNGWFNSDNIICTLKNNSIVQFEIEWAVICKYFCNYLKCKLLK